MSLALLSGYGTDSEDENDEDNEKNSKGAVHPVQVQLQKVDWLFR